MNDIKIAAAITLYEPNEKVADYIVSIKDYFETVYLFDNTESKDKTDKLRRQVSRSGIKYATKNENTGLGYALNVCCHAACKDGYQWLLLLDQDSVITKDNLDKMIEFIRKNDSERLAIVSPIITDPGQHNIKSNTVKSMNAVITAGMILKLEAFKDVGNFVKAPFLYYVDYEFCYRLKKKGYIILKNGGAVLYSNQYDDAKVVNGFKVDKCSPWRHYYHANGHFYIIKHYPEERKFHKQLLKNRCKMILLYESNKLRKLLAILLAYLDHKSGYHGRCRWKILM